MTFYKAHGLGNDYLVLETPTALAATLVRAICDRNRGIGSDGILEPRISPAHPIGLRIWNPDGSVAEKSGNGLRIFAWWASRFRGLGARFAVDLGSEAVACTVDGLDVGVAIGRARIEAPRVIDGLEVVPANVGNPHCVVFREETDLDALPWRTWGERLERDPSFPNRTNVQIARVVDPGTLELRVWERGAGPTLASGSSACAVAAVAVHSGRLAAGPIRVSMPGGSLTVTVSDDLGLHLQGPVAPIGRVVLDPDWTV